jgi:transketolase
MKKLLKKILRRFKKKKKEKVEPKRVYVLYATADKGEGRVMEVGRYENSLEEVEIIISMFDRNVILSISEEIK